MKLAYATFGTNDLEKAVAFYTELLSGQGIRKMFEHPRGMVFGRDKQLIFSILKPYDGEAASPGNGAMLAFELPSRDDVDAVHAKALELGGRDEGAPGERAAGFYMAYVRDLDGNKLALCKLG